MSDRLQCALNCEPVTVSFLLYLLAVKRHRQRTNDKTKWGL
jgi:hypothetical protein